LWTQLWEGRDRASGKERRLVFLTIPNTIKKTGINRILDEGLKERLVQMGNRLDTIELPSRSRLSEEQVEDIIQQNGLAYADGLFLSFSLSGAWEQELLKLPVPKVFLNFPPVGAEADSIIWDVYDGVQQSMQMLTSRNHERILY